MAVYVDTAVAQFENVNELRKFPFSDESSLVDRSGVELPIGMIVDAHMFVPCETGFTPVVKLTRVHISSAMISACFKSSYGGRMCAMSVTVSVSDFGPYIPYRMEKLAGSEDIGGVVSFGDITFPNYPETYFLENAAIHPCCVISSRPSGLRRIVDPRSGESVSGDVRISFSGHVKAGNVGNGILLSLEDGSESELASECSKATGLDVCGATPISSINGIRPDSDGNIVLWFH